MNAINRNTERRRVAKWVSWASMALAVCALSWMPGLMMDSAGDAAHAANANRRVEGGAQREQPAAVVLGDFANQATLAAQSSSEALTRTETRTGAGAEAGSPTGQSQAPAEQGMLYHLELPPKILLSGRRSDGRDLCVFNAEGVRVPFALRGKGWQDSRATYELMSLYPLWGKPQSTADDLVVSFTIDQEARLVPKIFNGRSLTEAPAGQELKGYVIPLPEEGLSVYSLAFTWDKGADNTAQFAIQTGSDLKNWRTLTSRASLVRFDGPNGPLESSSVALNGAKVDKYLRLLFDTGMAPAAISGITLERRSSAKQLDAYGPIRPHVVAARPATKTEAYQPAALEYTLPAGKDEFGALTADSLQLGDPKPGQYAAARVFTRPGPESPWRSHGGFTFFAVMRNNALLESKPMPLGGARVGQIRLESADTEKILPNDVALSLNYTPVDMYFLAQGPGPYTLAWYSERAVPSDESGVFALIDQGGDVRQAALSDIRKHVPQAVAEDKGLGWFFQQGATQYVLWGVLLLGVALLGGMAFQVARSMRKEP